MVERWFGKVKKLAFLRTIVEEETFEHTSSFSFPSHKIGVAFFVCIAVITRFYLLVVWSNWRGGFCSESYDGVIRNRRPQPNFDVQLPHACMHEASIHE